MTTADGLTDPSPDDPKFFDPVALGLALFLGGAGVAHFANPDFFDKVVPEPLPNPRFWTWASGVVELGTAALLVAPKTRNLGAKAALATFVGVYPANVWAALDGGYHQLDPPGDSAAAAWLRLPLQFPMFYWAWKVIQRTQPH